MGLATSIGYILQLLVLLLHFRQPNHFFRLSPKLIRSSQLREVIRGGCGSGRFCRRPSAGRAADNMYAVIRTPEDAVQESQRSYEFCLGHGTEKIKAYYLALCVEEMAMNILEHAEKADIEEVRADFRLWVSDSGMTFTLRDLSDKFDPTAFYALHLDDSPEAHLGIRMVTKIAKEIRYFSAYDSNNLIISI